MTIAHVEYTDTFGGDANYSWVKRASFTVEPEISNRSVIRKAKAEMGLTGIRGRTITYGDLIEFRPYGSCTVMFVSFDY